MLLYVSDGSPSSLKVEWLLAEINVTVDRKAVPANDESHWATLKKQLAHPSLPALVDSGFWLSESLAVIQYVVDIKKLNTPLYPKELKPRSLIIQYDGLAEAYLAPLVRTYQSIALRKAKGEEPSPALLTKAKDDLNKILLSLERVLSGQEYLATAFDFSVADIAVASYLYFLTRKYSASLSTAPRTTLWLEKCLNREAFQKIAKEAK